MRLRDVFIEVTKSRYNSVAMMTVFNSIAIGIAFKNFDSMAANIGFGIGGTLIGLAVGRIIDAASCIYAEKVTPKNTSVRRIIKFDI